MSMDGKSIDPDSGEQPGDATTFELLPTQVSPFTTLMYWPSVGTSLSFPLKVGGITGLGGFLIQ